MVAYRLESGGSPGRGQSGGFGDLGGPSWRPSRAGPGWGCEAAPLMLRLACTLALFCVARRPLAFQGSVPKAFGAVFA